MFSHHRFKYLIHVCRLLALAAGLPSAALAQVVAKPPVAAPAPDFGGSLLQLSLSLAAVVAMIFGTLWLLKKLTQQRSSTTGLMRVVAGTAVGARERVVIVEVGSTWLVLGVAPGRVSALAEIPRQVTPPVEIRRPASADFSEGTSNSFSNWLRRASGNNNVR